jgi:hypothetical protein
MNERKFSSTWIKVIMTVSQVSCSVSIVQSMEISGDLFSGQLKKIMHSLELVSSGQCWVIMLSSRGSPALRLQMELEVQKVRISLPIRQYNRANKVWSKRK